MSKETQQWATRFGVILAVAGSAVGLGNFLRFPGQAAANGGGAFMIPYFCALLLLGIPIGWAEWTMGRWGGRKGFHSAPAIMGALGKGRLFRYLGVIGVLIPLAVSFYYTYIEAWCLGYTYQYLRGGIDGVVAGAPIAEQASASTAFYETFTGRIANGVLTADGSPTFAFWVITFAVNIWLVFRGLSGGIEKFCSWAMPTMAVCALIVLIRVLTLGTPDPTLPDRSVLNGLGYMWNPDFAALQNPQTWLAAAGQIFFSLSVGFGVIINYASYMRKKDDVVLSGLTASATNELFEVGFGGMITLTASFVFLGLSGTIAAVQGGTFGLGFATLPVVFAHMPFGNLIGAIWFFMLFLAAITSSISMYQPTLAFIQEALGWNRRASTLLLVAVCVPASFLVMHYSKGGIFWSTIDDWVGTFLIFVLAMVQIICFSWIFGIERGWQEAHEGASLRIPGFYKLVMQYVAPGFLLAVFAAFCYSNLGDWVRAVAAEPLRQGALLLILATTLFLCALTWVGEKRWRAAGLDVDGQRPED
ncbi:MAG: sodium-dependent transporter [Vicinamibacteria bacterium]|nr:sodium-dependent transporter [Vicinamibacteria bacterium]